MKLLIHIASATLALLLLVTGCSTPRLVVARSPGASQLTNYTYAITPFADGYSNVHRTGDSEAAPVVASALETELMAAGCRVVSLGQEDITVSGVVTTYFQGRRGFFVASYTTVGFDVKATDKTTGMVLWKASNTKSAQWNFDLPPRILANATAHEIVRKLIPEPKTH